MSAEQHTRLAGQWMALPNAPLYDEWIPDEWLLRAFSIPAMAAVDLRHPDLDVRVFELDTEPVVLGRSIRVVISELGMAGIRQFRVRREVPRWWLYGPKGADVLALLRKYHEQDVLGTVLAVSAELQLAWRTLTPRTFVNDVLAVADATRRVGAVTLASALTCGAALHGKLAADRAFQSAIGLMMRDVFPDACPRLYQPWLAVFGSSSDTASAELEYPVSAKIDA